MSDRQEAERLRRQQQTRKRLEREQRRRASDPDEAQAHERRAEKARYLKDKLAEQAENPDR